MQYPHKSAKSSHMSAMLPALLIVFLAFGLMFIDEARAQPGKGGKGNDRAATAVGHANSAVNKKQGFVPVTQSAQRGRDNPPGNNRERVATPNYGRAAGRNGTRNIPPVLTPNHGNAANFHAWGKGRVPVTPNQ